MGLPNDDHVMRHVPYKKLMKDSDGNICGLLPQAFELRDIDKGKLSVNWIEYFNKTSQTENIESTILAIRNARGTISSNSKCAYGIGNVGAIKDACKSFTPEKVDIVHTPNANNKSHSSIIRLPDNDLGLMAELADEVFADIILNKDVKL